MATTAEAVKSALEATIKAITPTKIGSRKFRLLSEDMAATDEDTASSSLERSFEVGHGGGEAPSADTFDGYHDGAAEEVREEFRLVVAYPQEANHRRLDTRMRADVADLKHAINDPTQWASDVVYQRVVSWQAPEFDAGLSAWLQSLTIFVRFIEAQ